MHLSRFNMQAALLVSISAVALSALVSAQCATQWQPGAGFPGVLGRVRAQTMWDPDGAGPVTPRLVIGGDFTVAGTTQARNIAMWDPAAQSWSPLGTGATDDVEALVGLPNGQLIAAGSFRSIDGISVNRIASFDGIAWSPLGSGMPSTVYALLAMPNGDLVAGGSFNTAGSVQALRVARWDGASWSAMAIGIGPGSGSRVTSLALCPNGNVVAGGWMRQGNGLPASPVRIWNGTAWTAPPFSPTQSEVRAVACMPNGDVIAAGLLTAVPGVSVNYIARWDGSSWSALGAGPNNGVNNWVNCLTVATNGDLLVGGNFTLAGTTPAFKIARWDGSSWSAIGNSISTYASDYVLAITELANGDLVAGGDFDMTGDGPARSIARWNGSSWSAVTPGTDGSVSAQAVLPNGDLVVAGSFSTIEGAAITGVARWDGTGWQPLGAGVDGSVTDLLVLSNGDLVVSGFFGRAGSVQARNIARWDGVAWSALGAGVNSGVRTMAEMANGDVAIGGFFTMAGGVPANRVARWDGTDWYPLGGGIPGSFVTVYDLAVVPNGDLVVTGDFSSLGNLARWDGTSWQMIGSGASRGGRSLMVRDSGELIIGGYFTMIDGVAADRIASWDGTTFSPLGAGIGGPALSVEELPGGDLLVGGDFFTAGGNPAPHIARWDGAVWSPVGTGANNDVLTVGLAPDGVVVAGGAFTTMDDRASAFLARLVTTCPATVNSVPTACVGPAGAMVLTNATDPWVGETFVSHVTGFAAGSLGVSLVGLTGQNQPLALLHPTGIPGCELLTSTESVQLVVPAGGAAGSTIVIPSDPAFAGVVLRHQFVQGELDSQGALVSLSSSNALSLTIGVF
ncbi:MAG: WD40 repeat domain-containing protein [bacterium]|nr:WD40 repeat domain-containing protein [bacterium]